VLLLKERQVLIPLWLLDDIVDLLDLWDDISSYPENVRTDYAEVMQFLIEKLIKVRLHESYSHVVFAKDDESRNNARIEYLKRKHYYRQFAATRA
jgi:hypothetical protein